LTAAATWNDPVAALSDFTPDGCRSVGENGPSFTTDFDGDMICRHVDAARSVAYGCTPLVTDGTCLGLLYLEQARFPGAEASLLLAAHDIGAVAENVTLALANLRLKATLREQSVRDPLTGLFNRRYLQETFTLDLARAIRSQTSLACLMLDVDHFKRFNDDFGHEAGDIVLYNLGRVLASELRKGDVVCRYGGEEFTILLPETSARNAVLCAEKIRRAVKNMTIVFKGQPLGPITVSIGLAAFPSNGATVETVLGAADGALLHAKRSGRDQVVAAEAEVSPERRSRSA
jgi:diguanylate cyclase (GGDEF)-like protein